MTTELERQAAKGTGRKYGSVAELMRGDGVSQEVQNRVKELENETRVVDYLVRLRQAAEITQEDMAKALGVTQSAISKLESGTDPELTLGEIRGYARATEQRIGLMFGQPLTHVESVKCHALAIRHHLERLAHIANRHDELEKDIQGFFGEAFFNILTILAECGDKLPGNGRDVGVRIEIIKAGGAKALPKPRAGASVVPV
ncbi:MAG TPA: helix-turn-helix domain-containing protein [Verrucomicrobiota bacterium]|nr:helix-turn-helix domain-containing protein [Verrucomicrobiota bacterium]